MGSARFLISPEKFRKVEIGARLLLIYEARHLRHVLTRALRSFSRLANSVGLSVVDARLRLRENSTQLAPNHFAPMPKCQPKYQAPV